MRSADGYDNNNHRGGGGNGRRDGHNNSNGRFMSAGRRTSNSDNNNPAADIDVYSQDNSQDNLDDEDNDGDEEDLESTSSNGKISYAELRRARLGRHATLPSRQAKHFSWSPIEDEGEEVDEDEAALEALREADACAEELRRRIMTEEVENEETAERRKSKKVVEKPRRKKSKSDQGAQIVLSEPTSSPAEGSDLEPLLGNWLDEDSAKEEEEEEELKGGEVVKEVEEEDGKGTRMV